MLLILGKFYFLLEDLLIIFKKILIIYNIR